uniref:Serpin domain-containing protein n=1 Tax=Salvator merianae TaxID=96440 RepID=A0A8D0BHP4_SALMN
MDLRSISYTLPKAITAFGLDLYKKLNTDDTCKNTFFSPLSISVALSMVLLGTKGGSKTQMEKVN